MPVWKYTRFIPMEYTENNELLWEYCTTTEIHMLKNVHLNGWDTPGNGAYDLTLEQPGNQVTNTSGLAQHPWARTQNTQHNGFIWCLVEILYFLYLTWWFTEEIMECHYKFSFYITMTQWVWIWFTTLKPRKILVNYNENTPVTLGGVTPIWGLLGYWSFIYNYYGSNKIITAAKGSKQTGSLMCGVTTGRPDRASGFVSHLKPSQWEI